MSRQSEIAGRYVYLQIEGADYRVYYEEAGQGIPLICQHTAGADGRQWRFLLEDSDVTCAFRTIVPDLPFHGKSLPPRNSRWWESEYRLTQRFFMSFVKAVASEVAGVRPAFIGASMGGHIAVDLALHYPDAFRAIIACEAALESHGAEAVLQYYNHPRISGEFTAATTHALCSPETPEAARHEIAWVYSQGAPGVFAGDLHYYIVEHDLTETAGEIDTTSVPVYVMSGEYDFSATPAQSRALASAIGGASFTSMEGLGHFPMCENYPRFKKYLMPILDDVRHAPDTPRISEVGRG